MNFKCTALVLLACVPLMLAVGIPGGQVDYQTTLTDPNVIFAVNAINEYYSKQGDNQLRTAVKLIHATSQVVSGAMFRYTIEVQVGDKTEVCTVAVWSRPWLTGNEATQLHETPSCGPLAL
ncbi:unnamed protein product [Lymnaea stagnalis]|uniref:Cystatin domain-containing protein n=1 Tax=Lymnaea stagnalis TaxID=6523 RepID=A0AAV2HYX3_LYMST